MRIIDWAVSKVNKMSINQAARYKMGKIIATVDEQARRETVQEILAMLEADMIDGMHLDHLTAVDMIRANWAS